MSSWTIEMNWRCKHCRQLNLGMSGKERDSLKCPNCGADKTDEEWIMPNSPETAPKLTGVLDQKARSGANWECVYCHASSRAGRADCESCGATREPVKPTPRKDPRVLEALPEKKPSWACWSCTNMNDGNRTKCKVCGRDRNAIVQTTPPKPAGVDFSVLRPPEPATPEKSDLERAVADLDQHDYGYRKAPIRMDAPPPNPVPDVEEEEFKLKPSRWSEVDSEAWMKGILIVGSIIGLIFFMNWLFTPNRTTATVAVMAWSRELTLQERHNYQGEGWRNQAPSDVYEWTHCETRQNGTHDCNPHSCNCHNVSYECNCSGGSSYSCNCRTTCSSNRNGSASCSESCSTCTTPRVCGTCSREECSTCYDQCPTYEEWCSYRYHQWDTLNQIRLRGGGHTAEWPDVERGVYQNPEFPHRTLSDEEYAVRWQDLNSTREWRKTYSFANYERFNLRDRYEVEWTRAGGFRLIRRKR